MARRSGDDAQPRLTNKQRVFVEEYLRCWNATEAARRAGYSKKMARQIGSENLSKPDIAAEIERRLDDLTMSEAEILARLTEHGRGDLGQFFKPIEEWTFFPLPSYEVIDAREVEADREDGDGKEKRVSYLVRHVVLDTEKLLDPRYSHLVKKFSDSVKNGLSIELYSAQDAIVQLGKIRGLFKERVEHTGKGGGPIETKNVDLARLSDEQLASLISVADTLGIGESGVGTSSSD